MSNDIQGEGLVVDIDVRGKVGAEYEIQNHDDTLERS